MCGVRKGGLVAFLFLAPRVFPFGRIAVVLCFYDSPCDRCDCIIWILTVVRVPLRKSREVEVRRKMKKWGEAEVNGTDERGEGEKSTRRSICSACILLVLFGSLLHILFLIVCVWFLFLFFLILSFSECREFCVSNVECVYCLPVRSTVRVRCFVRISYEIYDPERAKFSVWLGVEKWLKFVRIYRKQLIKSRGKRVGRNTAKGNLPRCV